MPRRNYNTIIQKPYPRTSQVNLTYPTTGNPLLTYTERDAIVDAERNVHFLDTGERQCTLEIDMKKRDDPIPLVNPATGEVIPGAFTNIKQIILCITALIRADQMRRDGPATEATDAKPEAA